MNERNFCEPPVPGSSGTGKAGEGRCGGMQEGGTRQGEKAPG